MNNKINQSFKKGLLGNILWNSASAFSKIKYLFNYYIKHKDIHEQLVEDYHKSLRVL